MSDKIKCYCCLACEYMCVFSVIVYTDLSRPMSKNEKTWHKKNPKPICFCQQTVTGDNRKGKRVRQRKRQVASIYQLSASPEVTVHEKYPPSSWSFQNCADGWPVGTIAFTCGATRKEKQVFLSLISKIQPKKNAARSDEKQQGNAAV